MMQEKDYLQQFASKPESFKEEVRIPASKTRKKLKPWVVVCALLALVAVIAVLVLIFALPHIEMPDFSGKNRNDVIAWVKQQEIEATGIVFGEEYNFDVEEDCVISQSVAAGKKIKKNSKLNFVISKGADPDEAISVPSLYGMNKQELQKWIDENKLSKVKLITAYNDSVAEGDVIDFSFTGCDEDSFTRNCSLKINISKGSAPAEKVTVEDFVKKPYETAESWAKSKKINLEKYEVYSDSIDRGLIISQSVNAGKTMQSNETLTVSVSLGKAVYMEDVEGWTLSKIQLWCGKNGVTLAEPVYRYSHTGSGKCIDQSLYAGERIDEDDILEVTISIGDVVNFGYAYKGTPYHSENGLHDFKDAENLKGADIETAKTYDFSDTVPAGCIINYDNIVEIGGVLHISISRGRNVLLQDLYDSDGITKTISWKNLKNEKDVRAICEVNQANCKIVYKADISKNNSDLIEIYRSDNGKLEEGVYLPQDVSITAVINDLNQQEG